MLMTVHNLPYYSTPFIGRSTEVSEIFDRFTDPNCRLLTLVGPGGIGKTRLAVQVAAQSAEQFTDAIYFVPFQSLASPDFMVSTIADVKGFHFNPGSDPKQQLLHHLRNLDLLLVLDNLEHLLDGVSLLTEILQVAPDVKILVTSRERLNLLEEWVFDVRELDYPATESTTDMESYDAVKLFLHHVRRINAHADLNAIQRSQVIRICRLVGGMPLGIELAAAWARTLSYEGIARGIEGSLDMLETSARNVEPRHRKLRATFEPMWNRLSYVQRSIFKQLSIFCGGFTFEAMEYVTGASFHTLSSLVERSLVRVDKNERYDLHELLRQYAAEQLNESPEELNAVRDRHCQYFTAYLDNRRKDIEGKRQQIVIEEIQGEIDNIRAAWQWAVEHGRDAEIGNACHVLWFFYDTRSWYQEALYSFEGAIAALGTDRLETPGDLVVGRLMAYYGAILYSLHMPKKAQDMLEKSLTILKGIDAQSDIGFARIRLGEVALFAKNDPETAYAYLRESLMIFQDLGNHWGTAYSLRWMAIASIYMDDYEEARLLGEASLSIYKESGEPRGQALALGVMGLCAVESSQYDRAIEISQEILILCEAVGLRWHPPLALIIHGAAACGLGDYRKASQYLSKGLEDAYEIPVEPIVLFGLLETVPWLIAMGDKVKALEILSFLLAYPVPPVKGKRPVSRLIDELQKELSDTATTLAIEKGKAHTLRSLTETCINMLKHDSALLQRDRLSVDRLTERELEVLHLVSKGLTNPQIATKLVLTVGTVKWHLHQIYTKLDVSNRTQAVARAQELNLLS